MYVNVAGHTVNLKLTSMNMTSLFNLEREARMVDAAAAGPQSQSRSEPHWPAPGQARAAAAAGRWPDSQ